jgi:hypothetical protein
MLTKQSTVSKNLSWPEEVYLSLKKTLDAYQVRKNGENPDRNAVNMRHALNKTEARRASKNLSWTN